MNRKIVLIISFAVITVLFFWLKVSGENPVQRNSLEPVLAESPGIRDDAHEKTGENNEKTTGTKLEEVKDKALEPAVKKAIEQNPNKAEEPGRVTEDKPAETSIPAEMPVTIQDAHEVQKETVDEKSVEPAKLSPEQQTLLSTITAKYRSLSTALRDESLGRLEAILTQAKAEYDRLPEDKKKDGKFEVYAKYVEPAVKIEAETEQRFGRILEEMRAELVKNGLPEGEIEKARKAYENEKASKINSLRGKF